MRLTTVIHQQVHQLKWYFLACLGLIMALPLEEAFVNLKDGDGFHSGITFSFGLFISPLLTGLIGCATVQADLDDKRYIFWRAKPVGAKSFIAVKFIVGLVIAMLVPAIMAGFVIISSHICGEEITNVIEEVVWLFGLMSVMAYSLCFFSNVLVRKTARGWLIGIVVGCFILILPFILPLDYKDVVTDMLLFDSPLYLGMMTVISIVCFVLSLFAADRDWHLKTNLKGLLWGGMGVVFIFVMVFSSQVANIKVKLEQEVPNKYINGLINNDGRMLLGFDKYVNIEEDRFTFDENVVKEIAVMPEPLYEVDEGYSYKRWHPYKMFKSGENIYTFEMRAYYQTIEEEGHTINRFEKLHLVTAKAVKLVNRNRWAEVSYIDLSDYLQEGERYRPSVIMRRIDDKLVVVIDRTWLVLDISDVENAKLIDKQIGKYKRFGSYQRMGKKDVIIYKIPIEGVSDEDRVRLSVDIYNMWTRGYWYSRDRSTVDIVDGRVSTFVVSDEAISRYDVYKTDDEFIYCKLAARRPFTILELMRPIRIYTDSYFIKNGNMYLKTQTPGLMVFDVRSKGKIRKVGHFVRALYGFEDWEVLDNGDIFMCLSMWVKTGHTEPTDSYYRDNGFVRKTYLCLLENPNGN